MPSGDLRSIEGLAITARSEPLYPSVRRVGGHAGTDNQSADVVIETDDRTEYCEAKLFRFLKAVVRQVKPVGGRGLTPR